MSEITELREKLKQANEVNSLMFGAIMWAMGVNGPFPTRKEGEGDYWWRVELRRRAGLAESILRNETPNANDELEEVLALNKAIGLAKTKVAIKKRTLRRADPELCWAEHMPACDCTACKRNHHG